MQALAQLWGDPDRVKRLGAVGAGNAVEVVINSTLGTTIAGLGDALRLAGGLGLQAASGSAKAALDGGHEGEDYAALAGGLDRG